MAIAYDRQDLAEELLDVLSSLPRGLNDDDIRFVRDSVRQGGVN